MATQNDHSDDIWALSNQVDNSHLLSGKTVSSGDSLSFSDIKRAMDYWQSEEYRNAIHEANVREAEAKMMLHNALAAGYITEEDMILCYYSIYDGYITLSSTFAKTILPKLKKFEADTTVTTTASPDSETTLEVEKNVTNGDERSSDD